MIVTIEIPAETRRTIRRHARHAKRAGGAMARGMEAAVATGAEEVRQALVTGELGLTMRHPASGLAASVAGWMDDPTRVRGAVGVPADSPASAYARIQEEGGTIRPKNARALAVPISEEAKGYSSPRDMADLTLIPRPGRPPLLVRMLAGARNDRWELHWVLVPSVTLRPTHWLSDGVLGAAPAMAEAFGAVLGEYAQEW